MIESVPSAETPLNPGDVIKLTYIAELRAFEDMIAGLVKPTYDAKTWATRTDIDELIRPKIKGNEYHGPFVDISLTVMDEPYERLVDAVDRGWYFSRKGGVGGPRAALTSTYSSANIAKYRGFELKADAHSTGKGVVGLISSEIWYYPLTPIVTHAGSVQRRVRKSGQVYEYKLLRDTVTERSIDDSGKTINRVVAKPRYEPGGFIDLSQTSKAIGLALLQHAIRRPISTPMQD